MKEFEHAYNVLTKVVEEGLPFNIAIRSSLKEEKNKYTGDFKSSISAVSGCALRHYFVFKEIVGRHYGEIEEKEFLLLSVGLANHIFAKRFDEEELNAFISKKTSLEGAVEFISSFNDPKTLIPEDIEFGSKKFLSLRHNLPIWLVNMWQKNAGPILSKKLFRGLSEHKQPLVRINTDNITIEEFLKKYSDFTQFNDEPVAVFNGKGNIKKHDAIINNDAFDMPISYRFMCKDLDIDPLRGIAIYGGSNNSLLNELTIMLGTSFKADYVCGVQKHYFDTLATIKKLGLTDVSTYEGGASLIVTCISKPVHTFFVCPENTYFLGLIERPDYFLTLKQENLDQIIANEELALNESAAFVEQGGDLVYFIPTFCKNEGRSLIHRFLNKHKEFTLVEEKQLFPFDRYQTFLYFAVLRKEVTND